jgi:hypothetical protein
MDAADARGLSRDMRCRAAMTRARHSIPRKFFALNLCEQRGGGAAGSKHKSAS